jgi:hypothetical protein
LPSPEYEGDASLPKSNNTVNSRGARSLTLDEIDAQILEIRRQAAYRHLFQAEWADVDRLRKRREKLLKEAAR